MKFHEKKNGIVYYSKRIIVAKATLKEMNILGRLRYALVCRRNVVSESAAGNWRNQELEKNYKWVTR